MVNDRLKRLVLVLRGESQWPPSETLSNNTVSVRLVIKARVATCADQVSRRAGT